MVIQITQCEVILERKDQMMDKNDLVLESQEMIDPTQTNGTLLVRHKRGKCCNIFNSTCCCKQRGNQCRVNGLVKRCQAFKGAPDCEGCRLGWRC